MAHCSHDAEEEDITHEGRYGGITTDGESGDGTASDDTSVRVVIDASDPVSSWRYTCPNGHRSIEPTSRTGGVWCRCCSNDHDIDDPHHTELRDSKTGELIPWAAIEVRE